MRRQEFMEYKRSEIGAGIFIVIAFGILAVMIFAVSDIQSLFKAKKEIKVLFNYSDGIEKNAQVRYSGIKIGKVTNVRTAPEYGEKVEVTLSVYRDAPVKQDTKASIQLLGIVGGKYVELSGGSPQGKPLEPGGVLVGEESFRLEDLTKAGLEVVGKLQRIANNLDRIMGSRDTARSVTTIVKNLRATSENIKDVTADIKTMTAHKEAVADVLEKLPGILKQLEDTTVNLKAATAKTERLVGDNKQNIDEALENISQMTQNLKDLTADVKSHPWKLIRKP